MNRRAPRFRPRVELLEAREVPSTFTVTRLADDALAGSLRWAITQANTMPGDDIIDFQPGLTGTIQLGSALPSLSTNVDVQGPGAAALRVLGMAKSLFDPGFRVFTVSSGATVSISGLTVSNGQVTGDNGGGIFNSGTLTISNSTISGNSARLGDNDSGGSGGGIFSMGTLIVNNSTINGNEAGARGAGGGIVNHLGTLTISNSTISGNQAVEGGGISKSGTLTVSNSTISGNRASVGGGILRDFFSTLNMRNTILAGNTAPFRPDLDFPLTSSGYNLIGNPAGGSGYAPTDILGVDPLLGPLQDNGGPTWTHALLPGSPAVDAGDASGAPEFDQRGLTRVVGWGMDIGAFEAQIGPAATFLIYPFSGTVTAGAAFDVYVFVLDAYFHLVPYTGTIAFFSLSTTASLPAPYTFQPSDGGIAIFSSGITFFDRGQELLIVYDTATFSIFGFAIFDVN